MIVRSKVQHYRVLSEESIEGVSVLDSVYTPHEWDDEPIGFVTALYEQTNEIDICLFEQMPAPSTMTACIAEKLTPEQIDALILQTR